MLPLKHQLSLSHSKWFAVYTRYRCEKLVHRDLQQKGIHSYLPLNRILRRYGKSKKWIDLPLISNYIFVNITTKDYVPVLETNHVLNYVRIARELIAIPEREIITLRQVTGELILEVQTLPQPLSKGDWVEIITGRLSGLKGILSEVSGKKKLQVELETIGYALQIELPVNQVRKIRNPHHSSRSQGSR